MDEFGLDRPELAGSLVSLEFGPAGRIHQLWVGDPSSPDNSEDFQFVCPPVTMGDEIAEDYYPGTIMLGVRTSPDDPWIVGRSAATEVPSDDDADPTLRFEYDFGLIDDLRVTGRYYEEMGVVPHIVWEIQIVNRSRRSVEVGELAFPFAMNNVLEGFAQNEDARRDLPADRVHVHPFIGGAASYLFAQRLNGRPPGLLIFPKGSTRWEFMNHVPASLATPLRWDGIPVVYVHSRAAIEREEWPEWFNGHTSIVMEPGDERVIEIGFASADRFLADNVNATLETLRRPAVRVFPSCVSPVDVGVAVEISGATPVRFHTDVVSDTETDSDEDGGFCFVRPEEPGPVRVFIDDDEDRTSEVHLLFIEPIDQLIRKRAEWIMRYQVVRDPGPFYRAIVPADNRTQKPVIDVERYTSGFGVVSSLADALFLAEKNVIDPERDQVLALDEFVDDFLEEVLQNPADGSVGSVLADPRSVATHYGQPQVYPLVFNLYAAMAKIADGYGELRHPAIHYLRRSARSALAMFRHVSRAALRSTGLALMTTAPDLIRELRKHKLDAEAKALEGHIAARDREIARRRYPFGAEAEWSAAPFEEAFHSARRRQDDESEERALRLAMAAKSLSPSWWWYGSDKRWPTTTDRTQGAIHDDKGELCLGGQSVANGLLVFEQFDRDYAALPEASLRAAFGAALGVWALVRADGAAGMAYCPDPSSRHHGMSWITGDVGIALWQYIRGVTSWALPNPSAGVTTFGCHFEVESEDGVEGYRVRPWDGVGRRIVVRQLGIEAEVDHARFTEFRFDARKRRAVAMLENRSDKDLVAEVRVRGMWGRRFEVMGREFQGEDGEVRADVPISARSSVRVELGVRG